MLGRVAEIRVPKMVVEYSLLGRASPPVVGAFVADSGIDDVLKLSEPPSHDRWDPDSRRLQNAEMGEEQARSVIRAISDRLKGQIRRFQSSATPQKPAEDRRLKLLERELGAIFHPNLHDRTHIEGTVAPVEVQFTREPFIVSLNDSTLQTEAAFRFRLSDAAEMESIEATLRVRVPVLEGDEESAGDLLPVLVKGKGLASKRAPEPEPEFPVTIAKKQWSAFTIVSDPYDRSWSVKVDVRIQPALEQQ
jgi:hypothetical protein